ncbi:hypothetical protein [Tepidibacillus sp. HK-1]|uniref:hypothetical protein n=1 Tax=Tepidibacillus sp. HK-1 TaxID=1883407 RepID=UPI0008539FE0|nr:hypothetical protein [Tepidibacillus sp. HK-1]GBF12620.1 hypothetical protein HK1_02687 [Tepidibacillus sp. HK-1]
MQVAHRHAIFTLDEGLWPIFLKHRKMLKDLTSLRKKSPTAKREGVPAPVKVGDEFRLGVA